MPRIFNISENSEDVKKTLARSFQSAHLNFLIGSGASLPAIPIAGTTEAEIAALFDAGQEQDARNLMREFLAGIQGPTNRLIADEDDAGNAESLAMYKLLLGTIETVLSERRTTLLPKRASIFSTNYDLLVEKAAVSFPGLVLNDGFSRVPSLDNRMEFAPRSFFNTIYNTGNLYEYKVEIPSVSLVKLHGSLSWKKGNEQILFDVSSKDVPPTGSSDDDIQAFIESYAVVLPETTKFRTTLMDSTYYELLRIYANELDRENTLLMAFGFSFGDEHILGITKRALKNPTLKLAIFAYSEAGRDDLAQKFDGHNNVNIIGPPDGEHIDFTKFNDTISGVLPFFGKNK